MSISQENLESNDDKSNSSLFPWLWTSLALLCGFLLAIASEIRMFTSHYHFYARFLQAPGTFITNIIILAIISRKSELKRRELNKITNASFEGISSVSERQSLNEVGNIQGKDSLFDWRWLIDIFYDKIGSESTDVNSQPKYKLNFTKV